MTDKEVINKEIERVLSYLLDAEQNIDAARDEIKDLINTIKVTEEVENFIIGLLDNEQIPEEIRNRAGEICIKI